MSQYITAVWLIIGKLIYTRGSQPFLAHGPSFKKYSMDHFRMLTSHEQLVETLLHIGQ